MAIIDTNSIPQEDRHITVKSLLAEGTIACIGAITLQEYVDSLPHLDAIPISVLKDIKNEIEDEVFDSLSDNGDDWFAASKVSECMAIIDKHINGEDNI